MSYLTRTSVALLFTVALSLSEVAAAQTALPATGAAASSPAGQPGPSARRKAVLPAFPALGPYQLDSAETYPLREARDGSGDLIHEATTYTARVARDGSVTFEDRRLHLLYPSEFWRPQPGPRDIPSLQRSLTALVRGSPVPQANPRGKNFPHTRNEEAALILPYTTRYRPDPMELCRSCPTPRPAPWLTVAGRFDITDEVMRFQGQDPYRYSKAKFLAATRELRIERAARYHAANVRRALAELPAMLQAIACDGGRSRGERQAIIEALRAELDGGTPEALAAAQTIDDFLAASAAAADADAHCRP